MKDVATITTDDKGLWVQDEPGKTFGMEWNEVYSVGGYKLDCVTELLTVLCFDTEYGEYFECNGDWVGFEELTRAVSAHLPKFPAEWFPAIESLTANDAPITIWTRKGQTA